MGEVKNKAETRTADKPQYFKTNKTRPNSGGNFHQCLATTLRLNSIAGQKSSRLSAIKGRVNNHATSRKMPGIMRQTNPSATSAKVTKAPRKKVQKPVAETREDRFDTRRFAALFLQEEKKQPGPQRPVHQNPHNR